MKEAESEIFIPGNLTDFEKLLFAERYIKELKKENDTYKSMLSKKLSEFNNEEVGTYIDTLKKNLSSFQKSYNQINKALQENGMKYKKGKIYKLEQ